MSVNKDRRKFLKILMIGSASFIAGKILGPAFFKLIDKASSQSVQMPQLSDGSVGSAGSSRTRSSQILSIDSAKPPRGKPNPIFTDPRLSKARAKVASFKAVEDGKNFSVYDASGEEIFQIDKGA